MLGLCHIVSNYRSIRHHLYNHYDTTILMIFFLILGVILGAAAVFFIAQNTVLVTVTFLSWQFESSLAAVLLLTIICGAVITLLILLPSLMRDTFYLSRLKKQ